jgi:beta-N-acetylhexosaminidase
MNTKDLSKFGKKILVEVASTQISDDEKRLLQSLQPNAIMLRKRNFLQDVDYEIWLGAYKKLIDQFREILPKELIISIDHEGGRVIRPPDPITKFPYAARWGKSVSEVAAAMAVELKSLAINVNFAPVADIHSNPDNPVINERAFGTTTASASTAAVEFARTLNANGIIPCAKHFPGHGDTKTDSHFGIPVVDLSIEELRQRELKPFQALIDDGIEMVMTAHILFPKIDPDNTATLSKAILNDLLREEMGFKGVIIADALGMGAISKNISEKESIAKAVNAGLDIFLAAGDNINLNDAIRMAELMEEALNNGEIEEETIHKSAERIDKFTKHLPQYAVTPVDKTVFLKHQDLANKLASGATERKFELNLPGFE